MATVTTVQNRLLDQVSRHPNFVKDLDTQAKVEKYLLENKCKFVYFKQTDGDFFLSCNNHGIVEHHGIRARYYTDGRVDWTNWVFDNGVHPTLDELTNHFLKSIK